MAGWLRGFGRRLSLALNVGATRFNLVVLRLTARSAEEHLRTSPLLMPEIAITSLDVRLQRQVDLARTAIDRGNTEYAINICRTILQSFPGCLGVRRLLRAAQLKLFKARNPLFARALAGVQMVPALIMAQAWMKKAPERALITTESALTLNPNSVAALRTHARAARALDLPETAVFALEAASEMRPENRTLLFDLADAYIAAQRTDDALVIADRLLKADPANGVLQELLRRASVAQSIQQGRWDSDSGSFRDKLKDSEEAVSLEQSNKAVMSDEMAGRLVNESIERIAAEPDNLRNYHTVIAGLRSLDRFDEAIEWLEKARARPAGAGDVTLEKLRSDLNIARLEQRAESRRARVVESGGDVSADPELIRMREELVQWKIRDLSTLAQKYPNDAGFKFELGRLYQQTGQIDRAIQQFQAAQRNPRLRVGALAGLGACFKAKRLFDLAVQQFETAKAEIPGFDAQKKEVVYELATCYEAMDRREQALEEYKLIYSWDIGFRDVASKIDQSYSGS